MSQKTLYFNKGILINDLKRFGWLGILYTIILFFAIPLQILMYSSRDVIEKNPIKALFIFHGQIGQNILIMIIPVLVGIFLFRYMQNKSSCDMIHSLPIPRSVIYKSHIVIGMIFLILPVIFNAIISLILRFVIGLSGFYTIRDILFWIGITILMNSIIFFTCVLIGTITGISILQGVLTYIFLILPLGLTLLIGENLKFFLYGFTYNVDRTANKLSPLVRLINGNDLGFYEISRIEILVYIIICIILYFLSMFIYNKRQLESATEAITFPYLQTIFKYGVAFCVMLLSGVYFINTQSTLYWILFGYLIGSFIGYFLSVMLIKKSIHVFRDIKGFGVYSVIIVVLIVGVKMDVFGYEKYIPKPYDIKSIYFSNGFNTYGDENGNRNMDVYYNENNIENIQLFHEKIIKDKIKNQNFDKKHGAGINVALMYNLRDGTKIKREYFIHKSEYNEYFKPIYESREYKNMYFGILKINPKDIEKLTFHENLSPENGKEASIINQQHIEEIVDALKKDIINATYQDVNSNKDAWAGISILISNNKLSKYKNINGYGNKQIYISWEKFETKAEKVLKKYDYLKDSRILPEDISYVLVEKINNAEKFKNRVEGQISINNNRANVMKVTDKGKIEECLRTYKNMSAEEGGKYVIGFYDNKERNIIYGIYHDNDIPSFIRNSFNK